MKFKYLLFLVILAFSVSGCAPLLLAGSVPFLLGTGKNRHTYSSFMKKVSKNNNSSPDEIKSILGKPETEEILDNGLHTLKYKNVWNFKTLLVLFSDNKVIYYGPENKYEILNAVYAHNLIDYDNYSKKHDNYKEQDEYNQRMSLMRAQENAARRSFIQSAVRPTTKTDCSPDLLGGFSCTTR